MNKYRAEHYLRRLTAPEKATDLYAEDELFRDALLLLFPSLDTTRLAGLTVKDFVAALNDPAALATLPSTAWERTEGEGFLGVASEEVLITGYDESWHQELSVTLLTYHNGQMELRRQEGAQFESHVEQAKTILAQRGLVAGAPDALCSLGVYMPVTPAATINQNF